MNHYKDVDEAFEETKLLCRFLNPTAAAEIFDKLTDRKIVRTESTESLMYEQMSKDLKSRYTPEELQAIMKDPKHYAELDVIKPA